MKVNTISIAEKRVQSKLANFPKTYNEAMANLLGQSDSDFVMLTQKKVKTAQNTKVDKNFIESAKKFFSDVFEQ